MRIRRIGIRRPNAEAHLH